MPPHAVCLPLLLLAWLGFHGLVAEVGPLYRLPFPVGASYSVLQGYDGEWGHQGAAAYAYDFAMPIGSPVTAARAGVVLKTEAAHADATRKPGKENFVFVDHGDGTFGRYYHLTRGGVLVAVGQRVVAGQEIGRSGDSGASAGPHLHFDVTRGCPDWGCQTIPVRFENSGGNPLVRGQTYQALPPPRKAAGPPPPGLAGTPRNVLRPRRFISDAPR